MTYVDDKALYDLFVIWYKGLRVISSRSASREMAENDILLHECKKILEYGYPAPRKRSAFREEVWFDAGDKTYNIVIVRDFNFDLNEEVYVITHVGVFGRKSWIKR